AGGDQSGMEAPVQRLPFPGRLADLVVATPKPVVREDNRLLPGGVPVRDRFPHRDLADPAPRLREFQELRTGDQSDPKAPLFDLLDEMEGGEPVQSLAQGARADAV